jgi:GTPase Era involved in 16S rRNA processing
MEKGTRAMTSEVKQLIDDTIALTGASAPALLDADAPTLATSSTGATYLIGLVGGKDVGKSSLVNALVGKPISTATSHGPGTETVIAYVHQQSINEIRPLLEREAPGRYTIVTHAVDRLRRQVLLDLPDIDSKYGDHLQLTRRMLRHMLYPIWIQSIEKYADLRPQELLSAVAEGNDPQNFVFCLNKADQLASREGAGAAEELRKDFAKRIARTIQLPASPQVFLISARQPAAFDLPKLTELLSQEKSSEAVNQSRDLADRRQDRSLFGWFQRQRLGDRAQQIVALEKDAQDLINSRITMPLIDRAIPRMLDDPGQRMALLAPVTRLRMSRWPIVNAIDALLSPVMALVQKNLGASSATSADPDAYLADTGGISTSVQAAFAQLHQLHPQLSEMYRERKLWESMHADLAAIDLRRRFAEVARRQQEAVLKRAGGRFHVLFAPWRWLLTIGAVLWFPIIQPVLNVMLQQDVWNFSRETLRVVVGVLSVEHLLSCVTFLLLWLFILWVMLRWGTQRRVTRIIERWKRADSDDDLSLPQQVIQWTDEMLDPIHRRRERVEQILKQAEQLRAQLTAASASPAAPAPALAGRA